MNRHPATERWFLLGCLLSLGSETLGFAPELRAEETEPAAEGTVKLDQLIVTAGRDSLITRAATSPAASFTIEELRQAGIATDLQAALKKMMPQLMGSRNAGAELANSATHRNAGGSSIALRNLPTIVLINGRRAATAPIGAHATGSQFVDLNVIPMSAVHSVEVLRDGGSSLYGADAIGGVVNITTTNQRDGGTLGGFYETAPQNGGWENRGVNFSLGGHRGRTHLFVAAGWSRQDPLWQSQRAFGDPAYGSMIFNGQIAVGAHYFVLNPALSAPPVAANKPAVGFPMTSVPTAPGGRPYFGVVDSDAVYWGRRDASGAIIGFTATELSRPATAEARQVAFNLANWLTLLQERETHGGIMTFQHAFNERLVAFGDILASRVHSEWQLAPQGFGDQFVAQNPHNPFDARVGASTRIFSLPRGVFWTTEYGRLVSGLRGDLGRALRFEAALNLNHARSRHASPEQVELATMRTAIREGRLNTFQRFVPLAELTAAQFLGTTTNAFASTLYGGDVQVSGETTGRRGARLEWTLGGEHREEQVKSRGDVNSTPNPVTGLLNWGTSTPIQRYAATRRVSALFLALKAPVAGTASDSSGRLDVSFDARGERYSDLEDPVVASIGLRWMPRPEWAVRARGGNAFSAPSLYQTSGPALPSLPTVPMTSLHGDERSGMIALRSAANAALEPERARTLSLGAAWRPQRWKGLTVEVDYVRVRQRGVIGRLVVRDVLQDVERRGADSPFVAGHPGSRPGFDTRYDGHGDAGQPVTAPGQIADRLERVFLTNPVVNLGEREVEAFDLDLRHRWQRTPRQSFVASLRASYTVHHRFLNAETAGRATLTNGTVPRWNAIMSLAYHRGGSRAWILHRAVASVFAEQDRFETGDYHALDLGVSHRFDERAPRLLRRIEVSLILKNAGDSVPRRAPLTFNSSNADTSAYDPIGRAWLLTAERRF